MLRVRSSSSKDEDSRWIDDGQKVALFFSLDQRPRFALSTCLPIPRNVTSALEFVPIRLREGVTMSRGANRSGGANEVSTIRLCPAPIAAVRARACPPPRGERDRLVFWAYEDERRGDVRRKCMITPLHPDPCPPPHNTMPMPCRLPSHVHPSLPLNLFRD